MYTSSNLSRSHRSLPLATMGFTLLLAGALAVPAWAEEHSHAHSRSQLHGHSAHQTSGDTVAEDYALAHHRWSEGRDRRDRRRDHRRDHRRHHHYDRYDDRYDRRRDRRYDRRRHHHYDHRYDHRYDRRRDYREHRRHYDPYRGRPWAGSRYHRGGFYISYGRYHGRHFDVPRVIVRGSSHRHHDYYFGRDYHREHDHHHDIYLFPVYYGDYVEYRPHVYCGGKLIGRGHFDSHGGLRIDFHFKF